MPTQPKKPAPKPPQKIAPSQIYSYKDRSRRKKEHTLIAIVQDRPGVLNRVTSLLRRRRFNIKSLVASKTEHKGIYHLIILVDGEKTNVEQVRRQLQKLIPVIKVVDITYEKRTTRELALIKIKASPENRAEILNLAKAHPAKPVDITPEYITLELTATPETIDQFIEKTKKYGLQEMVRTGVISLVK